MAHFIPEMGRSPVGVEGWAGLVGTPPLQLYSIQGLQKSHSWFHHHYLEIP